MMTGSQFETTVQNVLNIYFKENKVIIIVLTCDSITGFTMLHDY